MEITGEPIGRVRNDVDEFSVTTCLKVQKLKKICVITFENRERCFFSFCHERGTKEKNCESP